MELISEQDVRQLAEIGFAAARNSWVDESRTIFEGLETVRPDSEYPLIGLAVSEMSARRHDEAIVILQKKALKLNAESSMAQSFLGLALRLVGRSQESERWLKQAASSDDAEAAAMAQALLADSPK